MEKYFCWHVYMHVCDEALFYFCLCHVLYVCSGKDFASSTVSSVHICTCPQNKPSNIITDSVHIPSFSSPLFDLVKHPIISLIIAILVVLSLPSALPHLPNLLGNPEGDLELNPQPFPHYDQY